MLTRLLALSIALVAFLASPSVRADGWKAGPQRSPLPPKNPSGWPVMAPETTPPKGPLHDLWAKALAVEDPSGSRSVLLTVDICGISRPLSTAIRDAIQTAHHLDRSRIVIACSHTHSGPVVGTNLLSMYPLDEEQKKKVESYAGLLQNRPSSPSRHRRSTTSSPPPSPGTPAVAASPLTAARTTSETCPGSASPSPSTAPRTTTSPSSASPPPTTRSSPSSADTPATAPHSMATVFSGDYAGYAQIALEKSHPGAVALFWAGCGADQNPLPRGSVEQAQDYGTQLAQSVEPVLARPMNPVQGRLRTSYKEIDSRLRHHPRPRPLGRTREV